MLSQALALSRISIPQDRWLLCSSGVKRVGVVDEKGMLAEDLGMVARICSVNTWRAGKDESLRTVRIIQPHQPGLHNVRDQKKPGEA